MDQDKQIQLLAVIQDLQSASADAQTALKIMVEKDEPTVILDRVHAMALHVLLDVQSVLVRHLIEENSEIKDRLDALVRKINIE